MRAKFIYEKFSENSDPVYDLGIGLYTKKNFSSYLKLFEWMYKFMPIILNLKNIEDLIAPNDHECMNTNYITEYTRFIDKYLTIKRKPINDKYCPFIDYIKSKRIKESLNEKFEAESDPIKDMGIGSKFLRIEKFDLVKLKKPISNTSFEHIFKTEFRGADLQSDVVGVIKDIKFNSSKTILQLNIAFFDNLTDATYGSKYIKLDKDIYITIFLKASISKWDKYFEIIKQDSLKESLNEKFKEESDPIKDMGIGYPKRLIDTMSWKILEFIKSKGEEGVSLKEIQFFIWTKLKGYDPKEFFEPSQGYFSNQRKSRGYWNTNLLGGRLHSGLLHKYCRRNERRKWVFVKYPKQNEFFYK